MIKFFIVLILSILGGFLYRLGGKGKPFNTKFRDIGVPLCGIGIILTFWKPNIIGWLTLLSHFTFAFITMTTYWDKLFDYDNFYFHGLMTGLSAIPLHWAGIHFYPIIISAVICGLFMGLWSRFIKNVNLEESGRGFIYCMTRMLLFI